MLNTHKKEQQIEVIKELLAVPHDPAVQGTNLRPMTRIETLAQYIGPFLGRNPAEQGTSTVRHRTICITGHFTTLIAIFITYFNSLISKLRNSIRARVRSRRERGQL